MYRRRPIIHLRTELGECLEEHVLVHRWTRGLFLTTPVGRLVFVMPEIQS